MTFDIVVGFFVLGVLARLARTNLKLPEALYEMLSIAAGDPGRGAVLRLLVRGAAPASGVLTLRVLVRGDSASRVQAG